MPKLHHVQIHKKNETLNSVVGSKNPKIRFYSGSDSNDFRVACAVAQRNLRYAYVDRTLEALNIEPGTFCTNYNERMTTNVNKDKCRKSTIKFKTADTKALEQFCTNS